MQPLVRGLAWPVLSLAVIGIAHLTGEVVRPELHDLIGPAVAMPIYLAAGAWAATATIRAGGAMGHGLMAGVVLGLLPVGLQIVGFGLLVGQDASAVTTAGMLGWLGIFWGSALGAGIAASWPALGQGD